MIRIFFGLLNSVSTAIGSTLGVFIVLGLYLWLVSLLFEPHAKPSLLVEMLVVIGGLIVLFAFFIIAGFAANSEDE